jgi:hypothetical protein
VGVEGERDVIDKQGAALVRLLDRILSRVKAMGATDAVRVNTVGARARRNRSPMTALS